VREGNPSTHSSGKEGELARMRWKSCVFAIDPRTKQTVYMERHEWESGAAARIKEINADASPLSGVRVQCHEHTVGEWDLKKAYTLHQICLSRRATSDADGAR
jgi:hypothetical protein